MRGPPRARHLHRGGGGGFLLFFAITVAQGSGEDLVAAQQCYKLSNVHPPTSYEVRGSPLTAPTLAFLPPVLAYCCSRGLLFTIVVHQGYCCSVVTVNNNNTVQKLTFGNSIGNFTLGGYRWATGECWEQGLRFNIGTRIR